MISHLNNKNKPIMVNINDKKISTRSAKAQGEVKFKKSVFKKLQGMRTKKGEISNIAILAGIMASKKTSDLIPLCHNINLEKVNIEINANVKKTSFIVIADIQSSGKTGVEMEALTAVSVTCLTIYDMCKSLDKGIIIKEIKLISKKGGKSDFLTLDN